MTVLIDRRPFEGIEAVVPCRGCTACCENDIVMLHPECGDDPAQYETVPMVNPVTRVSGHMLAHKPSGGCVYLGQGGCTIHDRRPTVCREFDCGKLWARHTRAERRRMISNGYISTEVMRQGRRVQQERGEAS